MGNLAVRALRVVMVMLFGGSVVLQAVFIPLLAADTSDVGPEGAYLRTPVLVIFFLGVVACQVILVCVWRLVTMVRRGTVFSHAAFRYVDVVIGAITAAALLVFAFAFTLGSANRAFREDVVAPGIVLIICGGVVAILGVALIVLVLRALLAQAVARDAEAAEMRAELDEVI